MNIWHEEILFFLGIKVSSVCTSTFSLPMKIIFLLLDAFWLLWKFTLVAKTYYVYKEKEVKEEMFPTLPLIEGI